MQTKTVARSFLVLLVFAIYLFLGTMGLFDLKTNFFYHYSHYMSLAEGFKSGHLSMSLQPDPHLATLKDPYDPAQNTPYALHDASYYKGKNYLYYGPFPVLTFYLPWGLLTNFSWLSDAVPETFFLWIGFLLQFLVLIKIKEKFLQKISEFEVFIAGSALAFANFGPFILARPAVYEVAIAGAYSCISAAFYFLYKFMLEKPRTKYIALFSLFLSLSIASRPDFVVANAILIPCLLLYLIYNFSGRKRFSIISGLLIPPTVIAILLALYNYLRFDSPFEFGVAYSLAGAKMQSSYLQDITTTMLNGFRLYFLRPYTFLPHQFPHIFVYWGDYAPFTLPTGAEYVVEKVVGIFYTAPFLAFLLGLPFILLIDWTKTNQHRHSLVLFSLSLLAATIPIIVYILMLRNVTQRYAVDFAPPLIFLSILSAWLLSNSMKRLKLEILARGLLMVTAIYSIFIGIALGFSGFVDLFAGINPGLFTFLKNHF